MSVILLLWTPSSVQSLNAQVSHRINDTASVAERNMSDSLFYKGLLLKFENKKEDAILEFRKFVQLNPNEPAAYFHMALIYGEMGRLKDALPLIEKAFQLNSENPFYRSTYADILALNGKYEKGARLYNELLTGKTKKTEYLLKQYTYFARAKRYNQMLDVIKTIDEFTDIDDEVIENLKLEAYSLKGDKKNIEKILLKRVEANPNDNQPKLDLVRFYELTGKTKSLIRLKREFNFSGNTREDKLTKLVLLIQSNDMEGYLKVAKNTFSGTQADTAEINLFMESYMNHIFAKDGYKNAQVIQAMDDIVMSKTALPEAAEFLVGYFSAAQLEPKKAFYSKKALDLKSKDHNLFLNVMNFLNSRNLQDSTVKLANHYLKLYDSFPMGHYYLGAHYYKLKNYEESLNHFLKLYDLLKNTKENVAKSTVQSNLGDIYAAQKLYDKADAAYELSYQYDSTFAQNLNNYAYSLSERKVQLDKALKLAKKAVEKEPNNSVYLDTYAWALYQNGNYEDAKKYILLAIEKTNNPIHIYWDHLAEIELKLGNSDKAKEYWETAIATGGNAVILQDKINRLTSNK